MKPVHFKLAKGSQVAPNQSQFEGFNWAAFNSGEAVYNDNGEVIGYFVKVTKSKVILKQTSL